MIRTVEGSRLRELEKPLESCKYDRVIIDSVLEGKFGKANANSLDNSDIVRLDSRAFTILAGDPDSSSIKEILNLSPIHYIHD